MRRRMITVLFGLMVTTLVLPATVQAATPAITQFSPPGGPLGTTVTIAGSHLSGATSVTFNGTAGTISSNTATTIKAIVPAGASTGKLKVTTPRGAVTSTGTFTVTLGILVSQAAAVPNATVKVSGAGFTHGGLVDLTFDAITRTTIKADAKGTFTNVGLMIPAVATVGAHTIAALNRSNAKQATKDIMVHASAGTALVYALDGDASYLTNAASDVPSANAMQWLYDGLYEYAPDLAVVPDLASAPATISPDGLSLTIHLVTNATFQPTGTPLTADDVVFTYNLAASPNCSFNPSMCLGYISVGDASGTMVRVFKDVKKIDDHTVQFHLNARYAPFETLILPGIVIDSKAADQASFVRLNHAAGSVDQIAAAYAQLDIQRRPVGTGPFYVASPSDVQPGQGLTFTRNPTYFRGPSALPKIYLPIIPDSFAAATALKNGQINWQYQMTPDALAQVQGAANVKVAQWPDFGFFGLFFNNRKGALFSDLNLRKAAALCFDKSATVQAATNGASVAIDGDISPTSWAFNPNITKYQLDVARANQLIQASGWVKGPDGVYAKGGRKFQTVVPVRAGQPERIKFTQLWANAMNADCGAHITVKEADFGTLLNMIQNWPLTNPFTNRPFDVYFGGFSTSYDPDPYILFHSSQCVTKTSVQGYGAPYNFECWKDTKADNLMLQGLTTYSLAARKTIYGKYEEELATQLPVLFAWTTVRSDGVSTSVNGASPWTPNNMDNPTWYYPLEDITKAAQ